MRGTGVKNIVFFALLAAGCGGGYTPTVTPVTPVPQNAVVTGQYMLRLTSTNGHGSTTINTNFTQVGKTFTGAPNTLVCFSSDLSQCVGGDAAVVSITPTGTINGSGVSTTISFPSTSGTHIVTMIGTGPAPTTGTYNDTLGDSGTWSASSVGLLSATFVGTFNSTPHPLTIPPGISISLVQGPSFNLAGTATITNSPCIAALNFSGQAIGQAFILTDAANKASVTAVPNGNNFDFIYSFEPTAPSCAGDAGTGTIAIQSSPWDYVQPRR